MLSDAAAMSSVLGPVSEPCKSMHAPLYPGDAPSQQVSSRLCQFAIDIITRSRENLEEETFEQRSENGDGERR